MDLQTFDEFCKTYYNENQVERRLWKDEPIEYGNYVRGNFDYLKNEYKLYRQTGCVSCEH